jgi:dTDP-glucose pyrophosphorylase/CBS domain-containing protein
MADIEPLLITPDQTIREAMHCIEHNTRGIALVVDADQHLLGTITDGDIRRALLNNLSQDTPIHTLLQGKTTSPYAHPLTAPATADRLHLLELMRTHTLRHIPLLDEQERVVDLVTMQDILPGQIAPIQAVIMAGGKGIRLRPLTEDLPKPMLPVGGRPLLERIIEQLQTIGIRHVNITTHYKPEKIKEHFGDGAAFGINLHYIHEEQPLGTGGALSLLPNPEQTMLVINGDILTRVNFHAMLAYHQEHQADMTVAVRPYETQIPYGVVECEGPYIRALQEKPRKTFLVNAGIYLLEPTVYSAIPQGEQFQMTDLVQQLIARHRIVVSFPIHEYWLDIGQHADYDQAQQDTDQGVV